MAGNGWPERQVQARFRDRPFSAAMTVRRTTKAGRTSLPDLLACRAMLQGQGRVGRVPVRIEEQGISCRGHTGIERFPMMDAERFVQRKLCIPAPRCSSWPDVYLIQSTSCLQRIVAGKKSILGLWLLDRREPFEACGGSFLPSASWGLGIM